MKFSLLNLAIFVLLLCVAVAWFVDHSQLRTENDRLNRQQELALLNNSVAQRDYYTRLVGVQKLGELGTDASIPTLIFALGDPDIRICKHAREALETITKHSFAADATMNASGQPTLDDFKSERIKWTEWYRSKFPDDEFEFTAVFRKSESFRSETEEMDPTSDWPTKNGSAR